MKKKALIIIPVLLVILIVAGVGIYFSNNQTAPVGETEELKVDFFGEFEPFACNGDYTSYSYITDVTNQEGTRFYSKSSQENGKHNDVLAYVLPNGEEKTVFTMSNPDVDIEVMSYIDNALYYNISNSKETGINGLYRMLLEYDEDGTVSNSIITMRFNLNLEPMRASDNMLLLRSGEQYYTFDTQTGEYAPYN